MVKKGEISFILMFLIIAVILSINVSAQDVCHPVLDSSACGLPISSTGHGAVELCQTCFTCGFDDDVCPGDFSDGTPETDDNKSSVVLRVGNDRPTLGGGEGSNDDPVIHDTGNIGCETINGTCTGILVKNTWDGTWSSPLIPIDCSTNMGAVTSYVMANCSAPKTAGCQYCPDPDCTTNVRGITFDKETNTAIPAQVNVVSDTNFNIRAETSSSGTYSLTTPRGNMKVICTAEDYTVTEKNVFLQRGDNIVDCAMDEAACTPQCTLPDINGQPVCASKCDTQNTCNYFSDETKAICDGVPLGAQIVINRTNSTHVTVLTCCNGGFEQLFRPLTGGENDHIPNLLTRDYRKELNGVPVSLRVITYSTD